jgi:hypothetical protein
MPSTWTGDGSNYVDITSGTAVPVAKWPIPVKSAGTAGVYAFLGWYNGETLYIQTYQFSTDMTLTAKYETTASLPDVEFSIEPDGIIQLKVGVTPEGGMPWIVVDAETPTKDTITYTWFVKTGSPADDPSTLTGSVQSGATVADSSYQLPAALLETEGVHYYYIKMHYDAGGSQKATWAGPIIVNVRGDYEPTNTTIEKISVRNASVPLYAFTLPDGESWSDYSHITVEYYVPTSTGDGMEPVTSGRTRLYGPWFEDDFIQLSTFQNKADFDATQFEKIISLGNSNNPANGYRPAGTNFNNSFILDNTVGNTSKLAIGSWVTLQYEIDGSARLTGSNANWTGDMIGKNIYPDEFLPANNDDQETIYLGPYVCHAQGGSNSKLVQYYVKNVVLWHKLYNDKNIEGESVKRWAINDSAMGVGVWRRDVPDASFPEAKYECDCVNDEDPSVSHSCRCEAELGPDQCTKATCGTCPECFPPCPCDDPGKTAADCTCTGNCLCNSCADEYAAAVVALQGKTSIAQAGGNAVEEGTDTGVITMTGSYNDYAFFTFVDAGLTSLDFTETIVVSYEYVIDPKTKGASSGAQVTSKAGTGMAADIIVAGTGENGQYPILASSGKGTLTFDLNDWPGGASSNKDGMAFQNGPNRCKITMIITSVVIKQAVDPGAALGAVTFGASDVAVTAVTGAGTVSYTTGGYIFDKTAGYGNGVAYFTVNFGTGHQLSDYKEVTLKVKLTGDAGYKRIALLASENMATTAAGFPGQDDVLWATSVVTGGAAGNIYQGPQENFLTDAISMTLPIDKTRAEEFDGKQTLQLAFYCHANPQVMTFTDVVFVLD